MTGPVGIALIGMGWWGQKMLNVLQAAPADIRVVRAVEPNIEMVRAVCEQRGVQVSVDYADALNDPAVEAVVLATPHSLHGAQIEAAVAAGKHVFCEKPLALTHQIEANFSHDKVLLLDRNNWRLKADQAPAGGMTATGIHLLDLSVRLLGPAESVLCICEQLSSDLPQGDTVSAYVKFRGGGTSYVSASLANPFMSRFTVYGAKRWIDIRDKAHVEAPEGWIVTSATAGGKIVTVELPPAEPVKDNLVAFARAVRGKETYPITAAHLINNIALLEAVA